MPPTRQCGRRWAGWNRTACSIAPRARSDRARSPDRLAAGAVPSDKINVDLIGVRRPGDTTVNSLDLIDGRWFDTSNAKVAVLDEVAADKLGLGIGDNAELPGIHPITLKIIGIVKKPKFFAERWASVYIPMETFQHFAGDDNPPEVSRISIYLRDKSDFAAFKQRWTARLAQSEPGLQLHMRRENAGELERNLRAVQILSYFGGAVSMLTAMFIIFSALSMGVTERQRVLAMLRAVGAVKSQVFQLVLLEGLILAIIGVALGVPLGMLWVVAAPSPFSRTLLRRSRVQRRRHGLRQRRVGSDGAGRRHVARLVGVAHQPTRGHERPSCSHRGTRRRCAGPPWASFSSRSIRWRFSARSKVSSGAWDSRTRPPPSRHSDSPGIYPWGCRES